MFNADNAVQVIAIIVSSYLIGSFPSAYLLGKLKRVNIFEVGSGNMGGTNVARSMGKGWALVTIALDVGKGALAVWLARDIILPEQIGVATSVSATCVVVGHNWSLFATALTASFKGGKLRLIVRGGKGAATAFGAMLMIQPFQILVAGLDRHRRDRPHALCVAGRVDRIRSGECLVDCAGRHGVAKADSALVRSGAERDDFAAPLGQCAAPAGWHRTAAGRASDITLNPLRPPAIPPSVPPSGWREE